MLHLPSRRNVLKSLAAGVASAAFSVPRLHAAETISITITAGHAAVFPWVKALTEVFIPEVDAELAKTGSYRINWTEAYGGTISKLGSELETIEEGIADMGTVNTIFHVARMPLENIGFAAPFGTSDPLLLFDVMKELHQSVPSFQESWGSANQVMLTRYAGDAYQLVASKPIMAASDLVGMKIAGPPLTLPWINGTGAAGVSGSLAAYYNDIKSGVYQGAIAPVSTTIAAKLYEVAPNLNLIGFGCANGGALSVNKGRWDTYPDEVKQAISGAAELWSAAWYKRLAELGETGRQSYENNGKIIDVPEEERSKVANSIESPAVPWIRLASSAGYPAEDVLKGYMDVMRSRGVKFIRDWDKELQ